MAKTNNTKELSHLAVKNHIKNGNGVLSDAGEHRGLRLTVSKSTASWIYRYRSNDGKLKQVKLGSADIESGFSLSEARTKLKSLKKQRNDGIDPALNKRALKKKRIEDAIELKEKNYTVENMMEHYLVEHVERKRAIKSYTEAKRLINKDVIPSIGKLVAKDLLRSDIHNLIQKIILRAPVIACDVRREIRAAFEHAISAGRIPPNIQNPTNGVKAPIRNVGHRVFNEAELVKFSRWLPNAPMSHNARDVLLLTLLTACRSGEIVCAKWEDIDLLNGTYFLKQTKTNIKRSVQLSQQALKVLIARKDIDPVYVFPSNRKNTHIQQKAIVLALAHKKANGIYPKDTLGIENWSAHDLRRTARTWLSKLRCPQVIGEAILGHSKKGVLGTYDLHQYEDECKEWLQKWADFIDQLIIKDAQ